MVRLLQKNIKLTCISKGEENHKHVKKVRKLLYGKGEGDTTLVSTVSPARTEMLICMMQFD